MSISFSFSHLAHENNPYGSRPLKELQQSKSFSGKSTLRMRIAPRVGRVKTHFFNFYDFKLKNFIIENKGLSTCCRAKILFGGTHG
jgi:hypothetical protein